MKRNISCFIAMVSVAAFLPSFAFADSCVQANGQQDSYSIGLAKKGLKRQKKAEALLNKISDDAEKAMDSNSKHPGKLEKVRIADEAIPAFLLEKAKCVVIIPGEKSIGFAGYGIDYGAGISVCRNSDGELGKSSFVKIKGGVLGPQFGGKSTDRVLLFMNSDSDQILQKPSLKLGADVAVAAGPLGRDLAADTNLHLEDEVLSYSHTKGLYAGATLDGAVLQPDKKMTEAVEGLKVKRGFFERIGHKIAGVFHHEKASDSACDAAGAAAEINAAINPPAETSGAAVASDALGQKQNLDVAPASDNQAQAPELDNSVAGGIL